MRVLRLTRRIGLLLATCAAAVGASACGDVARTGRSPGYLIIDRLEGASGVEPDKFGTTVFSDVLTLVKKKVGEEEVLVPTIFGDLGRVTLRVGAKNPGTVDAPLAPTALNAITVTRFRVVYKRTDGRNTQGVDVPYAFDGGLTLTVPEDASVVGFFELVRHAAKDEPPLRNMAFNGGAQFIGTIAEISFFGRDQAGNEVTVAGTMSVSFGDFGDPD